MKIGEYTLGTGSIGWIIALIVLILCVVLWFICRPLSGNEALGLIALVALARLL